MKGFVICSKGTEDVVSLEVKELINSKGDVKSGCVIFDIKKLEDLCVFCYKSQSAEKVAFLFDCFDFNDSDFSDKIKGAISKIDFSKWLQKTSTFRVTCKKIDSELSSDKISGDVGALIIKHIKNKKKYKQKVDLDNPDVTILVYINKNSAYIGVDFSGKDLHKRDYKIFTHQNSLRSTISYSLLRIARLKPKEVLLDPFSHSGEIPIEAALYTMNFPVNYYSKEKLSFLKFKSLEGFSFNEIDKKIAKIKKAKIYCLDSSIVNLNAAKKNAKIAGINKAISFSRMDTERLDIKLDKETVDKIVTYPPELTRSTNATDLEKLYDEFFYQAEFILKKTGKIAVVSGDASILKKSAEKYKFKVEKELEVFSGKKALKVVVLSRTTSHRPVT